MEWLGKLQTTGSPPSARKGHSMTRLLDSSLVLVFGGELQSGRLLNDMYCLNVDRKEWRKIIYAEGPVPPPRLLHTATAISPTCMVVMCGDTIPPGSSKDASPAPIRDVWHFDIRTSSWMEIKGKEGIPPARSCHSAVFGNGLGQVPAIYVFGGFGMGEPIGGSTMYRLRIGDWKWECLPILVTGPDGKEQVIEKPGRWTRSKDGKAVREQFPSERESHGAIWLPGINGMLVVGGDGGIAVLDDCWTFVPSSRRPGVWKWRKLKLRMARGLMKNKLPLCAGLTLVALPTEKTQVLLWGGIQGPKGEETIGASYSYLLDIDAQQTTCLVAKGTAPPVGRLLHGFVRANNLLLAFGGCDSDGNVLEGLEHAKLLDDLKSVGLRATDFGPVAAGVAAGTEPAPASEKQSGEGLGDDEEDPDESEMTVPLVGPSSIPKGTPLAGRILEVTDYGYFVSVVIDGKLYKGVLVANPLKDSQVSREDVAVEAEEASGKNAAENISAPEPKRSRLDPAAQALPDAPQKPVKADEDLIIALD